MSFWLLSLALRAKTLLGTFATWAGRNPAWALCIALAALCGVCWHEWSVKAHQVEHLSSEIAQFREAQAAAAATAREALHHQEQVYQAKAQDADHAYQTQLAAAQSAADRYIAGHRVQSAPTAAENNGAGVPPGMPTDAVVVPASDVQTCSAAVTYGLKARDFVLSISAPAKPAAEPTDGN